MTNNNQKKTEGKTAKDTKKTEASSSGSVVVGSGKVGTGTLTGVSQGVFASAKKLSKNTWLVISGVLLIVIVGLWVVNNGTPWNKPLAEVDGRKIYKSDVKKLMKGSEHASEYGAAVILADKYLTEAMGKKYNVTISDEDAKIEYPDIETLKKNDPYAYQNVMNQVFFRKLRAQYNGTYKGKLVVAHFSKNVPYDSPLLERKKSQNPKLGDAAAIAADKKYAQDFITDLYNKVKSGAITFDQAMEAERTHPELGEKSTYITLGHSMSFDGTLRDNNLLGAATIRKQVERLKPGELTKPFVVRANSSMNDNSTAESYWLMVQLDAKSGGGQGDSFDEGLVRDKKELGYKIYVKTER